MLRALLLAALVAPAAVAIEPWNALAELRAHTPGPARLHLAVAGGAGQMTTWQCDCDQSVPLHGTASFTWQISAGLRYVGIDGASVGGEISCTRWKGLQHAGYEFPAQARPAPLNASHSS